ncbi:MAG: tail fiber domain-containing protein [Ignavibacteriales bacterium]|nr:tail fiber domain-containing protein [Ignavibacteriales bacterium]MBP9120109.1 tail fiber domain-containing protein [Ignavibacterium sp.]
MKTRLIILLFLFSLTTHLFSQNIDAKLGANGIFSIKNSSNQNILTIGVNDNKLNLNNLSVGTTLDQNNGIFYKSGLQFLHTYGNNNLFLGYNSGNFSLSSSSNGNIGIGSATLQGLTTGVENTAVGNAALTLVSSGNYNSSFGSFTLEPNTTGNFNSAFGYASLRSNQTGNNNTALGVSSQYLNTTGVNNTSTGYESLKSNVEGFNNTAMGYQSLLNSTGNYNTAVGFNAGSTVTTGANLTLIGIDANPSSPTANDEITLGNVFVQTLRCNTTTITSLSDSRDKKNIKDLSLGLNFLMKIQPREFNWDKREWYNDGKSDGSKMQDVPTAGFIAQELDIAQTEAEVEWLKLVLKENPDRIEASAGNLFPIVVKAVQDLKKEKDTEIAQLKSENEKLRSELESFKELQTRLAKIEQVIINSDVKFTSNITE